jgi:hypothetical protein
LRAWLLASRFSEHWTANDECGLLQTSLCHPKYR